MWHLCDGTDLSKLLGLPEHLLELMGITSLTTIASKGLSSIKYVKRNKPVKLPSLGTMLLENQIPSVGSYQMFFDMHRYHNIFCISRNNCLKLLYKLL